MNCSLKGPCPRCGSVNWKPESRGDGRWTGCRCRTCQTRHQYRRRKRLPHEPLYDSARTRAREAGLPFEITRDDVRAILSDWTCTYCAVPVGTFAGSTQPTSATLDRLIPEEGYTPGNTVLACHRCNAAKAEHTPTSLRAWADRIDAVINRKNPLTRNDDQS